MIELLSLFPPDESVHLILTLTASLLLFVVFRNYLIFVFSFVTGFLVDLDHLFDYFMFYGFRFEPAKLLNVSYYMHPAGKIYVLFHGWEYIVLLFILGKLIERKWRVKGVAWAMSLPYLLHLLWDSLSICGFIPYFFLYRLFNNFSIQVFNL